MKCGSWSFEDSPETTRQPLVTIYRFFYATSASDYEIDYLIATGLGGVDDVRNLWPEPYKSSTWNARVKDDLEERLGEMVC
jgi:hypothetical protein